MNFNFSQKPDYHLNTGLIDEMIRLYGTQCHLVMADKVVDRGTHQDLIAEAAVFNDFKAIKTTKGVQGATIEHPIWVLMSEPEGFGNGLAFAFNNFGLINDDTLQVYVSINSLAFLKDGNGQVHPKEIISNLLVFPNGKVMEITDCQLHVPGVNNAFVYSDMPSCYQFSLKSYQFDRSAVSLEKKNQGSVDTMNKVMIDGQPTNQNAIDLFFERQDELTALVDEAANEEVLVTECLEEVLKPGVQLDDVFGTN